MPSDKARREILTRLTMLNAEMAENQVPITTKPTQKQQKLFTYPSIIDIEKNQPIDSSCTNEGTFPDSSFSTPPEEVNSTGYAIYRCQKCQKLVLGFDREAHCQNVHKGEKVRFEKIEKRGG